MTVCKKALVIGAGFALGLSVAMADSRYVTDSVSVAVFPSQELIGEPVVRMLSGDAVDVLGDEGEIINVRTSDGSEGWVRASFLMSTIPASVALVEVNAQLEALQQTLLDAQQALLKMEKRAEKNNAKSTSTAKDVGWLKAELKKSRSAAVALDKTLSAKTVELVEVQASLSVLELEKDELKNKHDDAVMRLAAATMIDEGSDAESQPEESQWSGFVLGVITALLGLGAGFFAGYRWLDAKVRRRFGGIKVY